MLRINDFVRFDVTRFAIVTSRIYRSKAHLFLVF